ncbi:exodeoxyribonuclease VII large subunit [Sanyastnella coralliicola]|uniref:exodeoxyribonuclease VII large subunit n=1 Tax=Sanyastnella coralliicola TaxID=3069118 RepID=UPI0027B88DB9|nr:exodeoxyribonuclease VII large subunit [Longitalea sp. SCSIO 12813]
MSTESPTLKLSELTNALDDFFQKRFSGRTFWVIGEVSGHKAYPNRSWHFFDLIEKEEGADRLKAKMQVVAWSPGFAAISRFERETGQRFTSGLEVMIKAEVSFHQQYGLKLTVIDMNAAFTMGQMERKRRETLEKLVKRYPDFIQKVGDTFHTQNQDLALPRIIKRIAVITSPGAAGYEDFMHSLEGNPYGYTFHVDLFFSRVQGLEAGITLSRRMYEISSNPDPYDLAVMIRGGGAQTDLFVFDDFGLNREVAKSEVPLWAGIGHQRDQTIVDLFCHTSHKTPTKVAEAILLHNRRSEEHVAGLREALMISGKEIIDQNKSELRQTSLSISALVPRILHRQQRSIAEFFNVIQRYGVKNISSRKTALNVLFASIKPTLRARILHENRQVFEKQSKLIQLQEHQLDREHMKLEQIQQIIRLSDPRKLLKKGYTLLSVDGKIVKDASELKAGDAIEIETHAEKIAAEVKKISPKN